MAVENLGDVTLTEEGKKLYQDAYNEYQNRTNKAYADLYKGYIDDATASSERQAAEDEFNDKIRDIKENYIVNNNSSDSNNDKNGDNSDDSENDNNSGNEGHAEDDYTHDRPDKSDKDNPMRLYSDEIDFDIDSLNPSDEDREAYNEALNNYKKAIHRINSKIAGDIHYTDENASEDAVAAGNEINSFIDQLKEKYSSDNSGEDSGEDSGKDSGDSGEDSGDGGEGGEDSGEGGEDGGEGGEDGGEGGEDSGEDNKDDNSEDSEDNEDEDSEENEDKSDQSSSEIDSSKNDSGTNTISLQQANTTNSIMLGKSELKKKTGVARTVASDFTKTYTSFSGTDMVCIFEIPLPTGGAIVRTIGSVSTITYSIYNTKMPVRVLGNMNAVGFVFGQRSIAGTIVFTVFDRHWAQEMMAEYALTVKTKAHFLIDEMPQLNISISFANEYGQKARLALYGVTFVQEGQVMSLQDFYTENTFQFYATDIDYMTNVVDESSGGNGPVEGGDLPISLNNNNNNQDSLSTDNPVDKNKTNGKTSNENKNSIEYKIANIDKLDATQKASALAEYAADFKLNECEEGSEKGQIKYLDNKHKEKTDIIKNLYKDKKIDKVLFDKTKKLIDDKWKNEKQKVKNNFKEEKKRKKNSKGTDNKTNNNKNNKDNNSNSDNSTNTNTKVESSPIPSSGGKTA